VCADHQRRAHGIGACEHEGLRLLVETLRRGHGFVAVGLGVHEAMVDGHVVGEQFELFGVAGEFVYLAEKKLWNSERGTQVYRIIERREVGQTCCKSTSPAVSGLIILDNAGGQFSIMFLNRLEYWKKEKTGNDASIAARIGAWKPGVSSASIDLPKQKEQMMSIDMQRKA
jgi:hypothetical protein